MLCNPESTVKIIFDPNIYFQNFREIKAWISTFTIKILGDSIIVCWAYIILVHSHKTFWAVHTRSILKNTNSEKLWPISWSNRGQGSCAIKQIVAVGWYFFCKCADSTSHYLAKQLWGLEKPIWPSSKFDSENDDEMKSKEENMVFQIRSQIYLTHGFFVFETIIMLYSFRSGDVDVVSSNYTHLIKDCSRH